MAFNQNLWISLSMLCSTASLTQRSNALSCIPCEMQNCQTDVKSCAYGITKNVCGCCEECAKGPGEECGGLWNLKLSCGEGFTSVPNTINPDLPGICQPDTRAK